MLISFLVDIPLYLVIPIICVLGGVIAILYVDYRKSVKKYQDVVHELNTKMSVAVEKLNKTYIILEADYRKELREILDEAHASELKVIEVLNQMNTINGNVVKELNELSQTVNNINIQLRKNKSR